MRTFLLRQASQYFLGLAQTSLCPYRSLKRFLSLIRCTTTGFFEACGNAILGCREGTKDLSLPSVPIGAPIALGDVLNNLHILTL
jgi:hypothetical protein